MAPYPTALDPVVPVIVHCAPLTGFAEYIPGTVDNTTPFEDITPVDGWYDFSGMSPEGHQYIEPDFKLSFTWDKVNSGDSNNTSTSQDGSNYDKGVTSDFTFFDGAYRFISNWLLNTECQILNAVEVKIIDLIARGNNPDPTGNYRIFEIKSDNLEYAPVDEPCQFHVKLREQDNIWHCIHKTVIWDDWQGWFKSGGFNHPTFLTCIEPRPRLINSARMALLLFYHSNPSIALIDFLIPGNIRDDARKILNADKFVDAPLVQTYIQNVAGKCNMTTDTIFDVGQPFADVCLYFPQAGFMYENDDDTISPSQAFTYDNRWLITIAELFDKLKIVFAAEWYVTPLNKIVFKHTKDLLNLAPIYDFTAIGAEPIYDLKYSFNGTKKPAYGRYEYTDDGSDLASQEMSTLYSDIVDYDGPANNPMLEGERVKNFEFAPTGFIRDGRSKDYLKLLVNDGKIGALILVAIIFVIIAALAAGVLSAGAAVALGIVLAAWITAILLNTSALTNEFVDNPTYSGAVRLTCEQTLQPRLLLWDGISMQTAKTDARVGLPVPNPYYNPSLTPYDIKNKIGDINDPNNHDNPSGAVYNYPLYFDGDYYDNLFPLYHDPIDNPLKSLETHQNVGFSVDLCVSMLNLFGVFQNQYAQIGKIVKLETRDNYDVFVKIGNINVDYDANKIYIKGVVIRRKVDQVDTENEGNIPVVTPEESAGPPPADEPCMKWINQGSTNATVSYVDCDNNTVVDAVIPPEGIFCSIQIISVSGGDIQTGTVCEESGASGGESGSTGSSGSSATVCHEFMNFATEDAIGVSYIDCNGNLVAGVTIPFMGHFCGQVVVNNGSCGSILTIGLCPDCAPCCTPTIISVSLSTVPEESGSGSGEFCGGAPLRLLFDDITQTPVADPTSVSDWNTFFDTAGHAATPFDAVNVVGNEVQLCGATGLTIIASLFDGNTHLISVIDDAHSIVATDVGFAFRLCTLLTYVDFPVLLTLGDSTFFDCPVLETVLLPSCTSMGATVFRLNTSLTTITAPNVTAIGDSAFLNCTSLPTVNFPLLTTLSSSIFANCTTITSFDFPNATLIEDGAFDGCTGVTSYNLPNVVTIGSTGGGFQFNTSLTTLSLPSCTTINGIFTFNSMTSLTDLSLPVCSQLGDTTGDDNIFSGITGQTITLTILTGTETDGDVVTLQANNTVTLILV